jgi:hypothetical protein
MCIEARDKNIRLLTIDIVFVQICVRVVVIARKQKEKGVLKDSFFV